MAVIDNNFNNTYINQRLAGNNVSSKGTLDDIKKQENLTGKIADTYDPTSNPKSSFRSFIYALLMSVGAVRLTNWLLNPKNPAQNMTATDSFTHSRMYQIGAKADGWTPLQWLSKQCGRVKSALKRIPLPQFIKEFGERYKIGSISTWDTTGMYSIGKHAEAMQEFAKFFSEVDAIDIKKLGFSKKHRKFLTELMKKVRTGKINPVEAYKEMEPLIKHASAKVLKEISPKTGLISKALGTTKDLSLSFNKAYALSGAAASGAVGKSFNKLVTLLGEATGGGVLGGKMALFANALGLMTGFVAASEAEKGDKLKAFMEDYIGFTIGGYLMSMAVGKSLWHKPLAWTEFGMDLAKAKEMGKELGLEKVQRVQDVVIGFNKEVKRTKPLNDLLKKFEQGKVVEGGGGFFGWLKRLVKGEITVDKVNNIIKKYEFASKGTDINSLKAVIKANTIPTEKLVEIRNGIKQSMKSDITFGSIFKGKNGNFFNRLGRYLTQKPIAAIGRFLSTGKFTLLHPKGFKIGNFFRGFKRIGGGIGRMALFYALFLSPIQKGFAKLSHAIFGKPKKSMIDDDENKENPSAQNPINNPNGQSTNLIDIYTKAMSKDKQNVQPQQTTFPQKATVPVQQNQTGLPKNSCDNASYIPNQMLGPESYVDPNVTQDLIARRDLVFKKADEALANAEKVLKYIRET